MPGLSRLDAGFVQAFIEADFGLPIAHENANFDPLEYEAYAELLILQNGATAYDLAGAVRETDGVYRVILRYPEGAGAMAAKLMADTIMHEFPIGERICYEGVCSTVVSHSRQPGVAEKGWYKTVITLGYKAFIRR